MDNLVIYQQGGLPAKPEELVKFVLFAQEKAKSLKAEIRAIKKLELAKEVYDQKMEEQRRLLELILAADQKIGEFTRNIAKDNSFRGNQHVKPTSRQRELTKNDISSVETRCRADEELLPTGGKKSEKTKAETIRGLGLSTSQVHRFETMAAHPEIVEEVIAESKAGLTNATQGEVLRRIQEREQSELPPVQNRVIDLAEIRNAKFHTDMAQIDEDSKIHKKFLDAIYAPLLLPESSSDVVSATIRATEGNWRSDFETLEMAIRKLQEIQILMRKEAYKHGKK